MLIQTTKFDSCRFGKIFAPVIPVKITGVCDYAHVLSQKNL